MENVKEPTRRERYHHGDLRAQLIEATQALVEEKGPDNFSVSEACRRAGVSTAAPYKHFKDKTEMLREVAMAGMIRQSQQMVAEIAPHPEGSQARIVALGRVYIRFATTEPGVFRLMFTWSGDEEADEQLQTLGDQKFEFVQMEVAKCHGRTEIADEDRQKAFLLWSFVHGLSFLTIDGKLADNKMPNDLEHVLVEIAERIVPEAS
ncbi:TetR/AcrR family transcriptional regulator [Cognatiyoonia sp. IB215446]|uniref:TetR/AcrR family transcriptional regulator n=1 Tax=Cognatiyoonia sp. IB215446 TaxID=3097355 RepID=UPI002A1121EA|nr:TetR/AcrR family transcriptional regulator [Cognatiyoonia sp. IB215446]MDX8347411.1 TetR/AcrR family transcriptional regulator [Cognatiyoonia sp. IB215446]